MITEKDLRYLERAVELAEEGVEGPVEELAARVRHLHERKHS